MYLRILFVLLLVAGCQTVPTRVGESQIRTFELVIDKTQRPLALNEFTVILDTRASFDYGLNRVANSLHFPWESLAENALTGEVARDKRKAGLRLSLHGLQPLTPIVIVGNGIRGGGEEGRLAWTLLYLGLDDVQVASIDVFRRNWTTAASPPAKNVAVWTPQAREEMQVGGVEFGKLAENPKGRLENRIFIIDVRSGKEYLSKTKGSGTPDIGAINIEWREFYTSQGRPNPTIKGKLQGVGIRPDDRIIFISNRGVRSAAAAYALLAVGFTRVQNFTGGWNSILKK